MAINIEKLKEDNAKLLKLTGLLQFTVDQQKTAITELTKHLGDCLEYIDACEKSMERIDVLDIVCEDIPECNFTWDVAKEVFNKNNKDV